MAKNTLRLNPMQVLNAKPKEKEYNLADGAGLYLRVTPNGTKAWMYNYIKPHTNKRRWIGFGVYPDVSLADARKLLDENRELVKKNIDPKEYRQQERSRVAGEIALTFEVVAWQWLEVHATKVKKGTVDNIGRSFKNDVFPLVGKVPVTEVTAIKGTEVIKSIVKRGSLEIARKVARRMNSVMTFAVNMGYIPHNPLAGIRELIPSKPVKHHPTIPPEELPELMSALRYSNAKLTTRCLIEFQLHTMVRPAEAAEAEWSEFDFDNMLWTIPEDRMKMDRPHIVPITDQVLDILDVMRAFSGHRKHVFPSLKDPKKPANSQSANKALRDMGFRGRLVAHGMRALASTTLNQQEFSKDVIEAALAHKDDDEVRAAYNRATYLEQRKVMMAWWSEHIENAKSGKTTSTQTVKTLKLVNE